MRTAFVKSTEETIGRTCTGRSHRGCYGYGVEDGIAILIDVHLYEDVNQRTVLYFLQGITCKQFAVRVKMIGLVRRRAVLKFELAGR